MKNLFSILDEYRRPDAPEQFEKILEGAQGLFVERIISHGHVTPEGQWYEQVRDEWVAVIEGNAVLGYEDGSEISLARGDCVFIPRHAKHRVLYTSSPCIWLAIHGDFAQSHVNDSK